MYLKLQGKDGRIIQNTHWSPEKKTSNKKISEYIIEKKIPSIYIIGDKNPFYNHGLVLRIKDHIQGSYPAMTGAGHIFNEGEDLLKTMDNNKLVIEFLTENIELSWE